MSIIYLLYFIFSPLIFIILIVSSLFNKKISEHLKNQKKTLKKVLEKKIKDPIIIHAASAGEYEQIKPLLEKRDSLSNPIIQTFFSPTIYNKEKKSILFDACCYHPFDFPWSAYNFLKLIKPKKYIINRHDIWPHHIVFAKLLKIEVLYINANLKQDSLRFNFILKKINQWIFKKIDHIIVPSNEIKKRFTNNFKIQNISVLQDTRFIQIQNRINKKRAIKWFNKFPYNKTIILGSIDEEDWNVIYKSIKNNLFDLKLIIVPHEINCDFIDKIYQDIKELNLSIKRFTDMRDDDKLDCVIYDKVGDLLDIYKYGQFAYVGCGFTGGVHNVLEPALQGCYVSHGPNISLLDEAIKLSNHNLSQTIERSQDFTEFIRINDTEFLTKNKNKVFKLFEIKNNDFKKIKKIIYEN